MFDIRADLRPLTRNLDDLARRQVPFATARALTAMADAAAVANRRALPSIFDRPTPFTRAGIAVAPARKNSLVARVYVKERQAEYLVLEETGGTRKPERSKHGGTGRGQALVMPKAVKRNAFGNIGFRGLASLKRRKDVFVGKTANGTGGFFRRLEDGKLQPLVIFVRSAAYKPRFGFKARVIKVAQATMAPAFRQALAKALATARR
ncbi:hypothetical protein [Falsiroseomonas sp. CW058]|uniref:hypothetical protein n=1 Tax=Falsiroseomonas sp. CW058 TaxID=3388664 RepID=UPI003D31526F